MKARTLVLILCIGLMCLTGFGSTTADLTKNSKTEIHQGDAMSVDAVVSVNVVSQAEMDVQYEYLNPVENRFTDLSVLSTEVEKASLYEIESTVDNSHTTLTTINILDIEGDVGWQSNQTQLEDHNRTYTILLKETSNSSHRNPRDGIIRLSSFL